MGVIYDVGDAAPLRLLIDHADQSTVASIEVRSPSGVESELAAAPDPERTEWRTALRLTEPGVWLTTWTVEGTGAGVETHQVVARGGGRWRSYATTADLATWPGVDAVPLDAGVLLARATRLVDSVMVGARWEAAEGTQNLPVDPDVARAYADATCAQVFAWLEQGAGDYGDESSADDEEAAELREWARSVNATSISFSGVSIGLGKSSSSSDSATSSASWSTPADEAIGVLRTAGLWPPRPSLLR